MTKQVILTHPPLEQYIKSRIKLLIRTHILKYLRNYALPYQWALVKGSKIAVAKAVESQTPGLP